MLDADTIPHVFRDAGNLDSPLDDVTLSATQQAQHEDSQEPAANPPANSFLGRILRFYQDSAIIYWADVLFPGAVELQRSLILHMLEWSQPQGQAQAHDHSTSAAAVAAAAGTAQQARVLLGIPTVPGLIASIPMKLGAALHYVAIGSLFDGVTNAPADAPAGAGSAAAIGSLAKCAALYFALSVLWGLVELFDVSGACIAGWACGYNTAVKHAGQAQHSMMHWCELGSMVWRLPARGLGSDGDVDSSH